MWALTLSEVIIAVKGYRQRIERDHDRALSIAWHTANLTRARRFPSHDRYVKRRKQKPGKVDPVKALKELEAAEAALAAEEEANRRG